MVRVAFLLLGDEKWVGGVNYLKNLLYAISIMDDRKIQPVLFVGKKTPESVVKLFEPYAEIERSILFDGGSPVRFLRKLIMLIFGKDFLRIRVFKRYGIDVASHCRIRGKKLPFKTINWIPDFQHIHLPEVFSKEELSFRNQEYLRDIIESDCIVVSSRDAFNDLSRFAPRYIDKTKVLRFVAQPSMVKCDQEYRAEIEAKYNFSGKFFYLPNQFWKHKNHAVVFSAVKILKKRGKNILVICTGYTSDYRNKNHYTELLKYISDNNLHENIKILGLVEYEDVHWFMRNSVSVINPSFFEGWSSTVEEAKSIGKNMILSNIDVHIEQSPPGSCYFSPEDPDELADILQKAWDNRSGGPDDDLELSARNNIVSRTKEFARRYQRIVLDICKPNNA